MKVQCKSCKKLHVDGKWTSETAVRLANVYTYCPTCYDKMLNGTPAYHSHVGFTQAHSAVS